MIINHPNQERVRLSADVIDCGFDCGFTAQLLFRPAFGPPGIAFRAFKLSIEAPAAVALEVPKNLFRFGITRDTNHKVDVRRHDSDGEQSPFAVRCGFLKLIEQVFGLKEAQIDWRGFQ